MADLIPLFTTLLSELRTALPQAGASFSEVEDLLYGGAAESLAQQVIDRKRQKGKLAEVSEADLWPALIESLLEGSKVNEKSAPSVASDYFESRLATLTSQADRSWLILIPVEADNGGEVLESLTTATALRVVVTFTADKRKMSSRFAKACQKFGVIPASSSPTLTQNSSGLFVVAARGPEEAAVRQALRSLNVSRDALRFATHLQRGKTDLDSPRPLDAQTSLIDIVLLDIANKSFHTKIERNIDTVIEPLDRLTSAKVRKTYDLAARILEKCPEDARKQADLIWRIARSIRIFSRAVAATNRDLRFLFTVIAYEALLNRSDAPISEALSEFGALLTQSVLGDRVERARELKVAYKVRSLFVHEGRLPSQQLDEENMRRTSRLVFSTWAETMWKLLPFAEQGLTDKEYFDRLVRLKFGATFDEAFNV